jgi:DNA-binding response OmpR family regulator
MDRTYLDDADVSVGTRNDAVLVCTTDGNERARLAALLREEYPVRTADSEADALASIDGNVTVLLVDCRDDEFDLDRIRDAERGGGGRFQLGTVVADSPPERLRELSDAVVEKPVADGELRSTVRWLHRRGRYDKSLSSYYALSEKYATLVTDPESDADAVRSLEEELTQLRAELDDVADALDDADAFDVALSPGSTTSS